MNATLSPGNVITVVGAMLTVIGSIAYATDSPNLSLPAIFYGIPVLLGGLALKSSELPPARRITPENRYRELRNRPEQAALKTLLADVTRWRYGQKAHLESSLEALKLWDPGDPPQLLSVEELASGDGYGLRLRFRPGAVAPDRWQDCRERLGRFFGPGLRAELSQEDGTLVVLSLLSEDAAVPAAGA